MPGTDVGTGSRYIEWMSVATFAAQKLAGEIVQAAS
jgi:hypothetical protein